MNTLVKHLLNLDSSLGGWRKIKDWRSRLKSGMLGLSRACASKGNGKEDRVDTAVDVYLTSGQPHQNKLLIFYYFWSMKNNIPEYFSQVTDPRVTGRCLHLLSDILMIGLCTYLTGGKDYQDMRLFAQERASTLGDLVSLPNGVPSVDTFERVCKSIVYEELNSCIRNYGSGILSALADKQIVIDGKKQRGVSPTTKGNKGLYLLNVWVSENRICIAQVKVKDKSNEITAIPNALKSIDITDAVVSIDAMGTQRDIAELIVEKKGHYFLAVKNNQMSLCEDIVLAFKVIKGYDTHETLDADHRRIETHHCSVAG